MEALLEETPEIHIESSERSEGEDEKLDDQRTEGSASTISEALEKIGLDVVESAFKHVKKYPDCDESQIEDAEYPSSYKHNTEKEMLVVAYAENYRRQYVHLFRDRQPLLLCPLNECGIEKFVCTTICPTLLPFKELYHWQGCAEFVSDYLTLQQLPIAHKIPEHLYSPTTILERQKGNSFDYSTLLCSLLLGAGYDAYVVSGYATKEICLADESREVCPLLKVHKEVHKQEIIKPFCKYTVKPPRDLSSKFEKKLALRKVMEEKLNKEKLQKEEEERFLESQKPPPDPLYGLRVHSWILVKSGKREIAEDFFIEPFTGKEYSQQSLSFLGIESVWNHLNYWANMQDCSTGCSELVFDLYNTTKWEFLMVGASQPKVDFPDIDDDLLDLDEDDDDVEEDKYLDMPASWIKPIVITPKQFESRCPGGKKTILYRNSVLEKFSHYLLPDGLVSRLSVYKDIEQTSLIRTEEWLLNRVDKLIKRVDDNEFITENFAEGRSYNIKQHIYRKNDLRPFGDRTMYFYNHARVDGLSSRIDCENEMIEHFIDRSDYLYYRRVIFKKPVAKFDSTEVLTRPIIEITEKFSRNPEIDANEDVAIRVFVIAEDKILLTYHRHDESITSSTREFYKPPQAEEKGENLPWSSDMTVAFTVTHPNHKPPSNKVTPIYQNLVKLVAIEQKTIKDVRNSEEETREILQDRLEENLENELVISVYDTDRNEKAKKHRKEQELLAEEERQRKQDMEMDYLAPFLAQIGNPDKLNSAQAFKLKEDCLADLKQRLIDKANLIQLRFENETSKLHNRQQEYQQKQIAMTKDDEEDYFNYCSEAMFRIHILEMRLVRHKQTAPNKYMAMEQKLRMDPRLSVLL